MWVNSCKNIVFKNISIFLILIFILLFKYITPIIGLFVSSSKINLFDIEAISLSNNRLVSPDSINLSKIVKSELTPFPLDNKD